MGPPASLGIYKNFPWRGELVHLHFSIRKKPLPPLIGSHAVPLPCVPVAAVHAADALQQPDLYAHHAIPRRRRFLAFQEQRRQPHLKADDVRRRRHPRPGRLAPHVGVQLDGGGAGERQSRHKWPPPRRRDRTLARSGQYAMEDAVSASLI